MTDWLVAIEYVHTRENTRVGRGDVATTAWLGGMLMREYEALLVYADHRHKIYQTLKANLPSTLEGRRPDAWALWSHRGSRGHEQMAYAVARAVDEPAVIGIDPGVGASTSSGTGICAVVRGVPVFAATRRVARRGAPGDMCKELFLDIRKVVEHILTSVDPS